MCYIYDRHPIKMYCLVQLSQIYCEHSLRTLTKLFKKTDELAFKMLALSAVNQRKTNTK